jgi:molybdopterin converting factor small subunit
MRVVLSLYASLSKYLPDDANGKSCTVEIHEGTKVGQMLERLNVPVESVKMIFLNGIHAEIDTALKDGDRVGVFPPVAGG